MTPLPLRQFVVKVHSRCNIACTYCYVYEHADQSWRGRPMLMAPETVRQAALRIAEHARAHQLAAVHVVLHGGEPLLYGVERTRQAVTILREAIEPHCRLDLRIHTNAVLLTEGFCDLFAEHDVKVGVSLDGDQVANDRHRLFADGRGTHAAVRRGLALLHRPEYRHLYAGLLCVIDIRNHPIAVYEALAAEEPPRVDLLLPHSTWDNPPLRLNGDATEYAEWLGAIYDRWLADGRPFGIRTFDSIRDLLRGRPSRTESLGLTPSDLVVIETDGTLEQLDSLKTTFDGAPATGLDVFGASLDEAAAHMGIEARRQGIAGLCPTCRRCPVVSVCGGGLYPHRYSSDNGFENPSAYCRDLKAIIMHIRETERGPVAQSSAGEDHRAAAAPHRHHLSEPAFAALASGYGGAEEIRQLMAGQETVRRRLLAEVLRAARGSRAHAEAAASLIELDTAAPQALGTVLAHPYTRAWAVRCAEALRGAADATADLDHINGLALAAAYHAGVDARFDLTVRDGAVHLPTLGAALFPGQDKVTAANEGRTLTFTAATGDAGAGSFSIEPGSPAADAHTAQWQAVRVFEACGYRVRLEDTDPYRDCHNWTPDKRLSDERARRWQDFFAEAVALIGAHYPAYDEAMRTGLNTLMPIAPQGGRGDASAAARQAFGSVGAALPATPAALALLLIHEFQHIKLGAMLDLFDLFDKSDTARRHYAPWRPDPRPLEGLLQGAYAHIGVTEYWRVRRRRAATEAEQRQAEAQFARWRVHTAEAMDVLLKSGSLTALGTRLVEAMRETVTPWCDEPVGPAALHAAHEASRSHRAAYEAAMSKI